MTAPYQIPEVGKILDKALSDKCLNYHLHRPEKSRHNCRNYSCVEMAELANALRAEALAHVRVALTQEKIAEALYVACGADLDGLKSYYKMADAVLALLDAAGT